jgi:hypothetical protein
MEVSMKNKQIFKYVSGLWTDKVESLLDDGWRVVAMHPVSTKDTYGCYVLLEKNEEIAAVDAPIEMSSSKESTNDYGTSM